MKHTVSAIALVAAAAGLAGCGQSGVMNMLGAGKSSVPQEQMVQSNQNLSMPPDLRLPQPGNANSESQVAAYTPPAATDNLYASQPAAPRSLAAPTRPTGDIYEQNGISKFNPDGTRKTDAELQAELKKIYLAKKRQANPSYGTIWNLGSIFTGG